MMYKLLFVLVLFIVSCSNNIAGGGTEGGNTDVFAIVYMANGTPASGAELLLTEKGSTPLDTNYTRVSRGSGGVDLRTIPDGVYTVVGRDQSLVEQLIYQDVIILDGTTSVDCFQLDSTASVVVTLPPNIDPSQDGEIILDGTDLSSPLSDAIYNEIGDIWQISFDTVPPGNLGTFTHWNGTDVVPTSPDLTVRKGEEITVEQELIWSNRTGNLNLQESSIVLSSTLDSSGQIWIGTSKDGIFRFDGENWHSESGDATEMGLIWDMITHPDGTIIYCGDAGVRKLVNGVWENYSGMDLPLSASPYALAYKKESDQLFIGFDGLGLYSWKEGVLTYELDGGHPWLTVFDLAIDDNGVVWAATNEGSYFEDGGWFQLITDPLLPAYSVSVGINSSVWFNHSTSVSLLDGDQWAIQGDYSMGETYRIAADPTNGNLYSAGFDFISIYNGNDWLQYRSTNGEIGDAGVFSILIVGDEVFIGVTEGVISFSVQSYM